MRRLLATACDAYCAIITELPFGEDVRSGYVSVHVYGSDGGMIDCSKCSGYFNEARDDYRICQ